MLTPARLEELRQMAGAVDGPKSAWMDELIVEVDRLNLQNDDLKKRLLGVCKALDEYATTIGPAQLGVDNLAKWQATKEKVLNDFASKRKETMTMSGPLCGEPCRSLKPCELHG